MTTFGLVHGAHYGAWVWERFVPELRKRGHDGVAVDLPIEDPNIGASGYADLVIEALEGRGDDVALVGHSMGGLVIPVVAERRKVRRLIFLGAVVAMPGHSLADQPGRTGTTTQGAPVDNGDGTRTRTREEAIPRYFHDCDEATIEWAVPRIRKQAWRPLREQTPLKSWPPVPSSYIVCADDRAVSPEISRWYARQVLKIEPVEIPGSHSPMLSRPAALADLMVSLLK